MITTPTMQKDALTDFLLFLGDTTLILAQRNAEWCAHGPILEQDIAITNISLDLIGQSRNFYQYAATLLNLGRDAGSPEITEDSLAYLRTERAFKNLLITELPNIDWAHTVVRQYAYSVYAQLLFADLLEGEDTRLAGIAEKSLKEISYHIKWSSEWVLRLGDGTDESHEKAQAALNFLWQYTGEFFKAADYETQFINDPEGIQSAWIETVTAIIEEATLIIPEGIFMQQGGKHGVHTEHMGYILSDLQYLQRTYPGAEW